MWVLRARRCVLQPPLMRRDLLRPEPKLLFPIHRDTIHRYGYAENPLSSSHGCAREFPIVRLITKRENTAHVLHRKCEKLARQSGTIYDRDTGRDSHTHIRTVSGEKLFAENWPYVLNVRNICQDQNDKTSDALLLPKNIQPFSTRFPHPLPLPVPIRIPIPLGHPEYSLLFTRCFSNAHEVFILKQQSAARH